MENSLYYTFSTIAQSLAALIGLLSAIALFRLQLIAAELKDRGKSIGTTFNALPLLQIDLASEHYQKFLAGVKQIQDTGTVTFNPVEKASLIRMTDLGRIRSDILWSFKAAFVVTAVGILASVAILAHVHMLTDVQWLLWLGIFLVAICLVFQTALAFRLLK